MSFLNSKCGVLASGLPGSLEDCHTCLFGNFFRGVDNLDVPLSHLRGYEQISARGLYLTPGICEEHPLTSRDVSEGFKVLREAYQGPMEIAPGAVYMVDDLFRYRLENHDILALGKDRNYVLLETYTYNSPEDFFDVMGRTQSHGYIPLLAHPERYLYLAENDCRTLHQIGVRFQLCLGSLWGQHGQEAQKRAEWLLAEDLYSCMGTELSKEADFQVLGEASLSKTVIRRLKNLSGLFAAVR